MKIKLLVSAVTVFATALGLVNLASAQENDVKVAPVDFRACTYRDGKGMKDLEKVADQFRAYAKKHDFDYSAWIMVPQFHQNAGYDVGWLGSWPSNEAFGISMEKWLTTGKSVAEAFDAVIDCSGWHELAMWVPVTAPDSTPEDGILMISQCSLRESKTQEEAYQAHIKLGNHMRGLGSMASSWLFYPSMGTQAGDFDYYHAIAFYRYSDLGAGMDLYYNGGGHKARAGLNQISSCGTPTVFDVTNVRSFDEG